MGNIIRKEIDLNKTLVGHRITACVPSKAACYDIPKAKWEDNRTGTEVCLAQDQGQSVCL